MTSGTQLKRGVGPALAALLLCLAACGKKEASAPSQPALTAPESVFPSASKIASQEKVPAQAEVKASSGPIELSLLLYKTKIKLGESLWHQLRIRNVGDKEIIVTDQVFHDPWQLRDSIMGRYGIYIEIIGPDGEPASLRSPTSYAEADVEELGGVSGLLEVEGPEEQAMLARWKKQGLTEKDISLKLLDFNTKKRRKAEIEAPRPSIRLQPGQSAETKSWFFYNELERIRKQPRPRPIGDFAELEFIDLNSPGEYRVRAVYDRTPTEDLIRVYRKFHHGPGLAEVMVQTPWVRIVVQP